MNHNTDSSSTPSFGSDADEVDTAEIKSYLQQMDPYDFEYFVGDIWTRMGWETTVSTGSADKGVDVTAVRHEPYKTKALIQAKKYGPNTKVGSPEIQQYASLKQQRQGVDKVIIVTTSEFTRQARELAQSLNVKLVNGDDLAAMVNELDSHDIVREHLDLPEPETETTEQEDNAMTTAVEESDGVDDKKGFFDKVEERAAKESADIAREFDVSGALPASNWKWGVWAGTLGWIMLFVFVESMPDAAFGLLFFTVWFLLPLSIYGDSKEVRRYADWPQFWRRWGYVAASFVWFLSIFVGAYYLWRRRIVSEAGEEFATSTETSAEEDESEGKSTNVTETAEGTTVPKETKKDSAERADTRRIEHDNIEYLCAGGTSSGAWRVLHGTPAADDNSNTKDRVFVYHDDNVSGNSNLRFTKAFENIVSADVSQKGVVAVVDNLDEEVASGKLSVYDASEGNDSDENEHLLTHFFNSNIADCAVSRYGRHASVSTLNPDCTTYVFDTESKEIVVEHQNERGNKQSVSFDENNEETVVHLSDKPDGEPLYSINLDGKVVSKSDELERRERLDELFEAVRDDPIEAIEELRDAYELAETDDEREHAALKLADAHRKLAERIEDEKGVTDDCWDHLNNAKERYYEVLPTAEGAEGAAEVLRRQGNYYIRRDADEAALSCFREVEELEKEHDMELLTEEDKHKIDEISD